MAEMNLEQRLSRLEVIEEIKRLKARYCAYCDDKYDPDGIAGLFTENGTWDGESFGRYIGREAIRAFFQRASGEITFAAHLVLNPIINVTDADHASGKWRLIMPATVRVDGRSEARWLVGAYEERYVQVGGAWLFESLKFHINFYTPHLGTWAESAVS
jgi:SnoaL-like domain